MNRISKSLHALEKRILSTGENRRLSTATTGARERLMADVRRVGDRLRADPNWRPLTQSVANEVIQKLRDRFGTRIGAS
jgi:hypothetical protein